MTGLPSLRYLEANCMKLGQFGTGVCPSFWRRQPTVPAMRAVSKAGVPPIDSAAAEHCVQPAGGVYPGSVVNGVPRGMIRPCQPRKSHTGDERKPERKQPRGSAQASPTPGGVSVPLVMKIARGAINDSVDCAST